MKVQVGVRQGIACLLRRVGGTRKSCLTASLEMVSQQDTLVVMQPKLHLFIQVLNGFIANDK